MSESREISDDEIFYELTDEQVSEFTEAFHLFDKTNSGSVTTAELLSILRYLGVDPTVSEMTDIMDKMDVDEYGNIQMPQFLSLMASKLKKHSKPKTDAMYEVFCFFDKVGNGFISAFELRQVMADLGEELTERESEQMIKAVDTDHDGLICYEEFLTIMKKEDS